MSGLDAQARERLHRTFEQLCRIPSETGFERVIADWVIDELTALGIEVQEDDCAAAAGAQAGNLLARIPGRGADSVDGGPQALLFCAHLDTVPLTALLEPVRRDGGWENAADGILGADNKAAVAAMLELARLLSEGEEQPPVTLELLFTVAEETGLNGSKHFDLGRIQSSLGFAFDHASPPGEIIVASPTHVRIDAELRGRAAHAGLAPELGVNAIVAAAAAITAMPQGRLDDETTANVGLISGGTATNVVAERCRLSAELRAVEAEQLDRYLTAAIDALQDGADSAGCDLDLSVTRLFEGYRADPEEPAVKLAARALRRIGYEPSYRSSGGGSDVNNLRLGGLAAVNLANGTEHAHEPTERVGFAALEANLELMLALVQEASA